MTPIDSILIFMVLTLVINKLLERSGKGFLGSKGLTREEQALLDEDRAHKEAIASFDKMLGINSPTRKAPLKDPETLTSDFIRACCAYLRSETYHDRLAWDFDVTWESGENRDPTLRIFKKKALKAALELGPSPCEVRLEKITYIGETRYGYHLRVRLEGKGLALTVVEGSCSNEVGEALFKLAYGNAKGKASPVVLEEALEFLKEYV